MAVEGRHRGAVVIAANGGVLGNDRLKGEPQRTRIAGIDFVKGALVMIMVLYHWLNYFVGFEWGGYRYLRFLTPSFVFLTGFLVAEVYLTRYALDHRRLHGRLIARGLKLLFVFCALNIAVEFTLGGRLHLKDGGTTAATVAAADTFLYGTPTAAFNILVSIAYFLLLTPIVLTLSKLLRIPFSAVAVGAVLLTALASLTIGSNPHVEMVAIGCVGLWLGTVGMRRVDAVLRRPVLLIALYAIYVIAVTRWEAVFLLQVAGVCLSLLLLYLAADGLGTDGVIGRRLVRVGQYSLLGYIVQVGALQVLVWADVRFGAAVSKIVPLAVALAVTVLAVEMTAALRQRLLMVDRLYRMVFV